MRTAIIETMTYQTDAKLPAPKTTPSKRYRKHVERRERVAMLAVAERLNIGPGRRTQRARKATGRANRAPTLRGFPICPLVYFIRAQTLGLIKIGSTVDLGHRLVCLQTGSPDKLELIGAICADDAFKIEERLHREFADVRTHGEWFQPSAELLALIAEWPIERMFVGDAEALNIALCA